MPLLLDSLALQIFSYFLDYFTCFKKAQQEINKKPALYSTDAFSLQLVLFHCHFHHYSE